MNKNPFKFGAPVEGDYYLTRPELNQTVSQFLQGRIHVSLIGPRRFGKTSFMLSLLKDFEENGYTCVFVDIFNITSLKDFLHQMLRAIKQVEGWKGKLKNVFERVKHLRPIVSAGVDPETVVPSFEFSFTSGENKDLKEVIQDVFASFDHLGKKVVVVIDEFQKITEIGDDGWLEATLRTHMQQLKNCAFLLTGSRKSIIYDMLNNSARPLYRSCQPIEFPSFGAEFTDWVVARFKDIDIECDKEAIKALRKSVQDSPHYVQMVCFHLAARGVSHVDMETVKHALDTVAKQNVYSYQTLLNTLTPIQQRALRLAAVDSEHIYAKENLEKYEIKSPAALASAIKALKDKGILDASEMGKGSVTFDDPLLLTWLKVID